MAYGFVLGAQGVSGGVSENDIEAHNSNGSSHPIILSKIEDIEDKLLAVSIASGIEVTANPFAVTYGSLEGTVSNGIWNKTNNRLEF